MVRCSSKMPQSAAVTLNWRSHALLSGLALQAHLLEQGVKGLGQDHLAELVVIRPHDTYSRSSRPRAARSGPLPVTRPSCLAAAVSRASRPVACGRPTELASRWRTDAAWDG